MKPKYYLLILLLVMPTLVNAGSDRLIMGLSFEAMEARQLIHIKFVDDNNNPISSELLKQGKVMVDGCNNKPLVLGLDYKYGYYSQPKVVGLYLSSNVWRNHEVCISLPGYTPIKEQFSDKNIAHSLLRTVIKH
ncbi:hypothetical protein MNBD_GAMMA18-1825 [hydrothermal vent metagenome]|uniref:Uncharacterized protein n=1 Tax=hydrothermal vent metagenome TaxID=652676 RepID=A0A3B0ZFZ2_9ZZZZ